MQENARMCRNMHEIPQNLQKYARNMQDARRERKKVRTPQKRQKIRRGETDWGAAGQAEKIRQGGT